MNPAQEHHCAPAEEATEALLALEQLPTPLWCHGAPNRHGGGVHRVDVGLVAVVPGRVVGEEVLANVMPRVVRGQLAVDIADDCGVSSGKD